MNLYQPTITGSLSVSGSVNISGSITIAGGGTISGTASIATTALTASFVANAQTASYVLNAVSSSFALTASSADNFLVRNTLTAQTLVVQTITSSVDFVTGSTRFGSIAANTMQVTGSILSSGSIGIGVTPLFPLHIYSNNQNIASTLATAYSSAKFRLETYNTSGQGISMGSIGGYQQYIQAQYSDGLTPNPLILQPYSGSVGIGTTTPLSLLDVYASGGGTIRLSGPSANSGTNYGTLIFSSNNETYKDTCAAIASDGESVGVNNANLKFYTGGRSLAMTINSSGQVGIGTNSPGETLAVVTSANPSIGLTTPSSTLYCYYGMNAGTVGGALYTFCQSYSAVYPAGCTALANNTYGIILNATNASGILVFQTNATERLRISNTGNFMFNTATSGAAYVRLNQPTGQDGGILWERNITTKFQQALDGSDNMVFYSYAISANAYKINSNGSATLYGALTQNASDRRLKNNITNIPNALDKIKTLNGVTFNWENNIFKTKRTNDIGVIAQEVQSVLPEAVALAPFDIDSEGNSKSGENYLTVQYEKLVPLLIEGIKEQQAQIEAQQQQINTLLNK